MDLQHNSKSRSRSSELFRKCHERPHHTSPSRQHTIHESDFLYEFRPLKSLRSEKRFKRIYQFVFLLFFLPVLPLLLLASLLSKFRMRSRTRSLTIVISLAKHLLISVFCLEIMPRRVSCERFLHFCPSIPKCLFLSPSYFLHSSFSRIRRSSV